MNDNVLAECIARYVGIYYSIDFNTNTATALRDSLSRGQLMSKLELVRLAKPYVIYADRPAFFVGHWHGLLPLLFYEYGLIKHATGVEIDPFWVDFSNRLNHSWDWKSRHADVNNKILLADKSLIINTSCEHMDDEWIHKVSPGAMVCVQSTDYVHPTHINRVNDLDEFAGKLTDFHILDNSAVRYDVYSRFSIIAIKK